MQLGFVIDHTRCIGCHACTVACKSENDVPLGKFRTWVKYTEDGVYPDVRRSFAVLRCNQCSEAPCVTICPVHALDKRTDGVVDVDPARCIGCKACMQGCPYDALYIDDAHGTAEKCHFCVHRTERGLAPACAVVCPTEAIVPGDFDDPHSRVSRMKAAGGLEARKTEAGTGPNVLYRGAAASGLVPGLASAAGGYLWAQQLPGLQLEAQAFEAAERRAHARTTYDVDHPPAWGGRVSAYLFTKSLAAGAPLAAALPLLASESEAWPSGVVLRLGLVSAVLLLVTAVLLVLDLRRPERFLFLLRYPNWSSWLVKGALVLGGYGALVALWILLPLLGIAPGAAGRTVLVVLTGVGAALTAAYTAWLFAQAKGRVLWLRRGLELELISHAFAAGAALLLLGGPLLEPGVNALPWLRGTLLVALALHLLLIFGEGRRAPRRREQEYGRAHRLVTHGPFAARRRWWGIGLGALLPLVLLLLPAPPLAWRVAAALTLVGLAVEQDTLVRAGQALPIS